MNLSILLEKVLSGQDSAFFYTPPVYNTGCSYYFRDPAEVIEAASPSDITFMFNKIDALISKGLTGYGYFSYELGHYLEEKLTGKNQEVFPLFRFCFFDKSNVEEFAPDEIEAGEWDNNQVNISSLNINTAKDDYIRAIETIKKYIEEGYTYQANYTIKCTFNFSGSPAHLFTKLLFNQSSQYSAFINTGNRIILSLSPELFFRINGREIITMPMKGTIKRGYNLKSDSVLIDEFINSSKNKAENLMIVDLLRNDLGKISTYGSVSVPALFKIEKYESLYQKVSVVKSQLKPGILFSEIIQNIFPSGSITGAPKIKTMQIIKELETEARGVYTGAIGVVSGRESVFNVAIRTISLDKNNGTGEIGIGSGIVWDSAAEEEYNEALLKADFLLRPSEYFQIIETMKYENGEIFLFEQHMERMRKTADFFLFMFNKNAVMEAVSTKLKDSRKEKCVVRLLLNKTGKVSVEIKEYNNPPAFVTAAFSEKRIQSKNQFQYFKTTNRKVYDEEYKKYSALGFYDVLFLNEKEEVCEGAVTNIFIRNGNNWFTPPVESGILDGVFRGYFIFNNPRTVEKTLYKEDILRADEVFLTNSVRGAVSAKITIPDYTK